MQVFEKVPLNLPIDSAVLVETSSPIQTLPLPVETERSRVHAEVGRYRLRMAETVEDRDGACRLRFKVFNIEMGEGLERSYETGLDSDEFDLFCEHLLVEDKSEPAHCGDVPDAVWRVGGAESGLLLGAGV